MFNFGEKQNNILESFLRITFKKRISSLAFILTRAMKKSKSEWKVYFFKCLRNCRYYLFSFYTVGFGNWKLHKCILMMAFIHVPRKIASDPLKLTLWASDEEGADHTQKLMKSNQSNQAWLSAHSLSRLLACLPCSFVLIQLKVTRLQLRFMSKSSMYHIFHWISFIELALWNM